MTAVITFLSDYGARRRLRRRLPRRDGADRARRAGHRRHARHPAPRRARRRADRCAARCPTSRRACTSRSSTRRSAASGARSRCARPRRTASSSGPTTALLCARRRALRRRGRGDRHRPLAAAPRAGVGDVPRARHLRPGRRAARGRARRWRGAGEPIDADELTRAASCRCARRDDDGALVAHALAVDRFGNVMLDVEHEELAGVGPASSAAGCSSTASSPHLRDDLRRRRAGRAAGLRGRLPDAGAGGEPRLGRRAARRSTSTPRSGSARA